MFMIGVICSCDIYIMISANEHLTCTSQITDVNDATITMKTTASMTCQCNVFCKRMPWMDFAFQLKVKVDGFEPNVCISSVGRRNNLKTPRKSECMYRDTAFSRDVMFCGAYICIRGFRAVFKEGGFCAVRLRGQLRLVSTLLRRKCPYTEFTYRHIVYAFALSERHANSIYRYT